MELHIKKDRRPEIVMIPLLKGIIITVWGILAVILFQSQSSSVFLIKSFGVLNLLVSVLTLIFTLKYRYLKISKQWLTLEFSIELIAGILFTFFITSQLIFMKAISVGIFFIVILQFIYGYVLLNMGEFNPWNIFMRFVTLISGAVIGVLLFTPIVSFSTSLIIIGLFSVVYGIINIQFSLQANNAVLGHLK